jgi:hypothetical protein
VAEAYKNWHDISETEALGLLADLSAAENQ